MFSSHKFDRLFWFTLVFLAWLKPFSHAENESREVLWNKAITEFEAKHYSSADKEALHHHRIATEITVVVSGRVRMFGRDWGAGSIVVAEPSDATDFEALADTTVVVVKLPSVAGDKHPGAAKADA